MLGIVFNEIGNNDVNDGKQLVNRFIVFHPDFVLAAEITGKVAYILMSPLSKVTVGSFEKVVETGTGIFLSEDHGEH